MFRKKSQNTDMPPQETEAPSMKLPNDTTPTPSITPSAPKQPEQRDLVESASQSTADFESRFQPPAKTTRPPQEKRGRGWIKLLITLIVLAALGGAGYVIYSELTKPLGENANQKAEEQAAEQVTPVEQSSDPVTYESEALQLSFEYPGNWTVDDSKRGVVTVTSPTLQLTDPDEQTIDASIVLSIVPSSNDMTDFPSIGVKAIRKSESFAYTSPAEGQRGESLLSFFGFSTETAGLNAVYITGDKSFEVDKSVTKGDLASVQPVIGVQFKSGTRSVAINAESWETDANLQAAFDILRSLHLQ